MNHHETFGIRLRKAQNARRISNADLADKTHLRPDTVSHWRNDQKLPAFWSLCEISKVLNVSLDYLCGFTDKMERTC